MTTYSTDPRVLTLRQNKTFRVVFRLLNPGVTPTPVSLVGYGATFQILAKPDGTVLVSVDDTSFDPGNPADMDVQVEPSGATGEIHIRLGADQTANIAKNAVYDCAIYSKTDATEINPVSSGPVIVLKVGAE